MPNDAATLLVGLAVLLVLAVALGMLSARLFMSASGGSDAGSGADRSRNGPNVPSDQIERT